MLSLQKLLTIQILISCIYTSMTLPVTSKPIENTPENLAWEAWIMFPPAIQGKTRKVSPKSIFILPNKIKNNNSGDFGEAGSDAALNCPPGHKVYDMKCIPILNIDRDQILITQLTNLLHGGDKQHSSGETSQPLNYEYDYDYGDEMSLNEEIAEPAKQVAPVKWVEPNAPEEPLKVQIFLDKFPIPTIANENHSAISKDAESLEPAETSHREIWQRVNVTSFDEETNDEDDKSEDDELITTTVMARSALPTTTTIVPNESNTVLPIRDESIQNDVMIETDNDNNNDDDNEEATQIDENLDDVEMSENEEKQIDLRKVLIDESLLFDDRTYTTTTDLIIDDDKEEQSTETVEIYSTTINYTTDQTTIVQNEEATTIETTTEIMNKSQEEETETERTTTEESQTTIASSSTTTQMPTTTTTTSIETSTNAESQDAKISNKVEQSSEEETKVAEADNVVEQAPTLVDLNEGEIEPTLASNRRFIYHHMSTSEKQAEPAEQPINMPSVFNINNELKLINQIVNTNRKRVLFSTTSQPPPIPLFFKPIATVAPTEESALSSTTTETSSPSQTEPLWWLPSGWRVDNTGEKPLLLRFWSKVPGL